MMNGFRPRPEGEEVREEYLVVEDKCYFDALPPFLRGEKQEEEKQPFVLFFS